MISITISDEAAMERLDAQLAAAVSAPCTVFLQGGLGAGKTTLARGFIRAKGHQGAVKSPTYTLVESYVLAEGTVHHFDLYRIADPEELEHLGYRDFFTRNNICLVEWPDRGDGFLPLADLVIEISDGNPTRELSLSALTPAGRVMAGKLGLIAAQ